MMQTFKKEKLTVHSFESREQMGRAAAQDIKKAILQVLEQKEYCNMIFAAAPSQNEVLQELASSKDIPWERVNAFHMDEYIGLAADAPQGFANFLRHALFDRVPFANVYCLNSEGEPEAEIARYSQLLRSHPTDIVVMGVGENGHIAFNDPHVAKFDDAALVKQVEEKEIIAKVKEIWTAQGNKIKDLKTLNLYVKPEENAAYYVINEDVDGKIEL